MKTKILLSISLILLTIAGTGKTWTVRNTGFSFSPETLIISVGDSVLFDLDAAHNVREVSEATWTQNGNTALNGGFSAPFGGGLILPASLTTGTHYYVCVPHASSGMKGQIIVQNSTGIPDDLLTRNISIYPNPSHGVLNIKSNNGFEGKAFVISDQTGRPLLNDRLEQGTTILDLKNLVPGIYYFQLEGIRGQSIRILKF